MPEDKNNIQDSKSPIKKPLNEDLSEIEKNKGIEEVVEVAEEATPKDE